MPVYKCCRCSKDFQQKSNYVTHINRKFPCIPRVLCSNTQPDGKNTDNLVLVDRSVIDQIADLREQVTKMTNDLNNNINNNIASHNNNNNNIVNNTYKTEVKLVAYGKEDLSHITDSKYIKFLDKACLSVPALIEYIHFDEDKPEHNNIKYKNLSRNHISMYDGKYWKVTEKRLLIDELYNEKKDALTEKYELFVKEKKLPDRIIRKYDRYLNDQRSKAIAKKTKEEIGRTLYNCTQVLEQNTNEIKKLTEK
jgi:hypothetical protein